MYRCMKVYQPTALLKFSFLILDLFTIRKFVSILPEKGIIAHIVRGLSVYTSKMVIVEWWWNVDDDDMLVCVVVVILFIVLNNNFAIVLYNT